MSFGENLCYSSRMRRSSILPVGAAVAAVALGASPGLAAAAPLSDKRNENGAALSSLLALRANDNSSLPDSHYSHSSHVSHSSHYSGSHNSHASHSSHSSHFSSVSPPPAPPPAPTPSPSPTASTPQPVQSPTAVRPQPLPPATPSPTGTVVSPTPTISPRPASYGSSARDVGEAGLGVAAVVVIGGVTYYVYERKRRSR